MHEKLTVVQSSRMSLTNLSNDFQDKDSWERQAQQPEQTSRRLWISLA
jgi:hypothetical protein